MGGPIGAGLAGSLLLLCTWGGAANLMPLTYILLMICGLWIILAIWVYRAYTWVLLQALSKRTLNDIRWLIADRATLAILQQQLDSAHVGVVLYALDRLEDLEPVSFPKMLQTLLGHAERDVRLDVLSRIERLRLTATIPAILERLTQEDAKPVQGALLRTLAAVGDIKAVDQVVPYLEHPDLEIRLGAITGLLRNDQPEVASLAGERLSHMVHAAEATQRLLAAQILGEAQVGNGALLLGLLLQDADHRVRQAALTATGNANHPTLWPTVVAQLSSPEVHRVAMAALVAGGAVVIPELKAAFARADQDRSTLMRLAQIIGRMRGEAAIAFLKDKIAFPDAAVRTQVLHALQRCGYQAQNEEVARVLAQIKAEVADAAWTLAALVDIGADPQELSCPSTGAEGLLSADSEPGQRQTTEAISLMTWVLTRNWHQQRERIFFLLSFIYEAQTVLRARDILSLGTASGEKRAYALEVLDILVSPELRGLLFSLLEDLTPGDRLQRLQIAFPQTKMSRTQRLQAILTGQALWFNDWTRACAVYTVGRLSILALSDTLVATLSDPDPVVRETAVVSLFTLRPNVADKYTSSLRHDSDPRVARLVQYLATTGQGEIPMLSTIERVLFFRSVDLFDQISGEDLVQVAQVAQEVTFSAGEQFITQGDVGNCLYIIVDGTAQVTVDGVGQIRTLGANSIIGEMAILASHLRTASCLAVTDMMALRIDYDDFQELMTDFPALALNIIKALVWRLEETNQKMGQIKQRYENYCRS